MKKMISALLAMFLVIPAVAGAELTAGAKDTIFVAPIQVSPSLINKAEATGKSIALKRVYETLETQFTPALSATRIFQMVERKDVAIVQKEQAIAGKAADENATAVQNGRLLGAKYAFIPVLDGFELLVSTLPSPATGRSTVTREIFLSAGVKIVETSSGSLLLEAPSVQLKETEVLKNLLPGQDSGDEVLLLRVAKELAQRLAQESVAQLRPTRVLSVSGKQVLINRGIEAGYSLGDQVEFFTAKEVKDEESGELYSNETPVGQGTIIRIDRRQAFVMINGDNLGIAKGNIVKPFKAAAPAPSPADKVIPGSELPPGSGEKPLKW